MTTDLTQLIFGIIMLLIIAWEMWMDRREIKRLKQELNELKNQLEDKNE